MEIAYTLTSGSGFTEKAGVCVALRHDASRGHFKPAWGDSWLSCLHSKGTHVFYGAGGWVTGAWMSDKGNGYFVQSRGRTWRFRNVDERRDDFTALELPYAFMGVTGIDDEYVLAWGDKDPTSGFMVLWDGQQWKEIESPGHGVVGVHGIARDLIVAVGYRGLIARWDGKQWTRLDSPLQDIWTSAWVADDKQIYVSGNPHTVVRGGANGGFEPFIAGPGRIPSVALWRDQLWLAAGDQGLFKVQDGALQLVRNASKSGLPFHPETLDARNQLVVTTPVSFSATDDGETFRGLGVASVSKTLADESPNW